MAMTRDDQRAAVRRQAHGHLQHVPSGAREAGCATPDVANADGTFGPRRQVKTSVAAEDAIGRLSEDAGRGYAARRARNRRALQRPRRAGERFVHAHDRRRQDLLRHQALASAGSVARVRDLPARVRPRSKRPRRASGIDEGTVTARLARLATPFGNLPDQIDTPTTAESTARSCRSRTVVARGLPRDFTVRAYERIPGNAGVPPAVRRCAKVRRAGRPRSQAPAALRASSWFRVRRSRGAEEGAFGEVRGHDLQRQRQLLA